MRLIIRPISFVCLGSQPQIKEAAFIFGKICQILLLYNNVLKLNTRLDTTFTEYWRFKSVLKWALACTWIRNQSVKLQNENQLLKVVEMLFWIFFFFYWLLSFFKKCICIYLCSSYRFRTPFEPNSFNWSKVVLNSVRRTSVHDDTAPRLHAEGNYSGFVVLPKHAALMFSSSEQANTWKAPDVFTGSLNCVEYKLWCVLNIQHKEQSTSW